ncbi:hypothetical protein J4H39_17060 [Vibrio alginolyticus]|uniref:hypothetical protein n=1 Tax=Vibrio TaxID=662 RepID=UPI001BD2E551|nr:MULTISPECIES: hypothetical protein [Vibrio]EGQ8153834.1 hypothetical protein [Vibrio alginolyticus]EGQ9215332.1 hypothetical protein [Vibrio alginolyticus]EGR2356024.1 hypothetical protein [Vibrio alginolyticus]EIC9816421.1 hypothetical protein [Vibrio alginolyticus]EIF2704614.1 hypothetical protein [Vibrio alginolyticus]
MKKTKLLLSLAMLFPTLANAADINPLTWERKNAMIIAASADLNITANVGEHDLAFGRAEDCFDFDDVDMKLEINGRLVNMIKSCPSARVAVYAPKTKAGKEYLLNIFKSEKPFEILGSQFTATKFNERYKELLEMTSNAL